MDLTMLPHLSDRALRDEAQKRGVRIEGLDRGEVIAAIRAHEALAVTLPPARQAPPPKPREPAGALGLARDLLGRVLDAARGALARGKESSPSTTDRKFDPRRTARSDGRACDFRDVVPEPGTKWSARAISTSQRNGVPGGRTSPLSDIADEPIRTRSMARVLEAQGHLERALAIVRDLSTDEPGDESLRDWAAELARQVAEQVLRARAGVIRAGSELELVDVGGVRGAVWRLDELGLARGRALLGELPPGVAPAALTLRVVRILAHADRSVEHRQEDLRPVDAAGWALLDSPAHARLIVAIGLGEGERFVSIAHASG